MPFVLSVECELGCERRAEGSLLRDRRSGRVPMTSNRVVDIRRRVPRAGVRAIALRCGGGWYDAELRGAAAIYDDPADLYWGTALFHVPRRRRRAGGLRRRLRRGRRALDRAAG